MEALENLKELRQLNLSDNMLTFVEGLEGCDQLETVYLKRNRFGKDPRGDVESLRGLLDRPSINTLDISDNYLSDPAIVDEVLVKMANLRVLYSSGNEFTKKVSSYRKTIIARIPSLKYLDDRPVFEEDRRRAEAYVFRGGIEAEREEMKKIKKEKSDKHWANHEAFQLMINKAREEKRLKAEAKEEKKLTMKEMMAAAKEEKSKTLLVNNAAGNFPQSSEDHKEGKDFFEQVDEKAKQRYAEKQAGIEHAEPAIPMD